MTEITPELVLHAYAQGLFPMADHRRDRKLFWVDPELRGIIPLAGFHIPRRLARTVRQDLFTIRVDTAFDAVITACASAAAGRTTTWISGRIADLYGRLHAMGRAHSVEAWQGDRLVGGLYGVSMGAAFFGESMFSLATDASKVALVHLVARLRAGGYCLLDTQFATDHLRRFGTIEIERAAYRVLLDDALARSGDFGALDRMTAGQGAGSTPGEGVVPDAAPAPLSGATILQSLTQMS